MTTCSRLATIPAWILCLVSIFGCAGLSVEHLPRREWKTEAVQTLPLRYLTFRYRVLPVGEAVGVTAEAVPDTTRLPEWISWCAEAEIDVYLTDAQGRVLASSRTGLLPRPLDVQTVLPVEARFDLGTARHQPLFVTFGYRLTLTDGRPDQGVERRILISEGALEN